MSALSEIAQGVFLYRTQIDPVKATALVEQVSETFPLEQIQNRPHLTMEFPTLFNSKDSLASIKLRSLVYFSTLPAVEEYMSSINLYGFSIKKPYISVSKLLPDHGGMPAHKDNHSTKSSHFICMLYLNDDYLGGEVFFPDLGLTYKPQAGNVLIYKANNLHEVLPVLYGVRYTVGYGLTDETYLDNSLA
jgi:hypothetical protein